MHLDAWSIILTSSRTYVSQATEDNRGQADGISNGLDIQDEGTFKFSIKDDKRKVHTIRIPNSLYLPEMQSSGRGASCCPNIGHRRQEVGKHGWGIMNVIVC